MKSLHFQAALAAVFLTVSLSAAGAAVPVHAAGPAAAAGNGGVTLTGAVNGHTYKAYCIFTGTADEKGRLTQILWGPGVSADAQLIERLRKSPLTGKRFANVSLEDGAAAAAAAMKDAGAMESKAFADALSLSLKDAAQSVQGTQGSAVFTGLPEGYYLLRDESAISEKDGKAESVTQFMLRIVSGQQSAELKSAVPSLTKRVREDSASEETLHHSEYKDAADCSFGDTVSYKLIGTLPDNYDVYDTYRYVFRDQAGDGFSMKGADSVKVYLADHENAAYQDTGTKDLSDAEGLKITCSGHDLTVQFEDLKKAVPSFRADQRIIVTYDCVMNGNAVCGSKGNENRATLSFSNDPNEGGKGRVDTTPQEKTKVYTYQLLLTKTDSSNNSLALGGAVFELYRKRGGVTEYATGKDGSVIDLTGWTKDESSAAKLSSGLTGAGKGKFGVRGLDSGTYYVKELQAPDGYRAGDDVKLVITAGMKDQNGMNGKLDSLKISVEQEGNTRTHDSTSNENGQDPYGVLLEEGTVRSNVTNRSSVLLPVTGGTGTAIFYGAGITVAAMAGIVLLSGLPGKKGGRP
ncbi:MAG: isopeptide-forming domain-containing fimbrial protein [Firmicutes bacterium]|nr:isopeptide-forming domain-containing fimbrial protein [Bacillota bacterium]